MFFFVNLAFNRTYVYYTAGRTMKALYLYTDEIRTYINIAVGPFARYSCNLGV